MVAVGNRAVDLSADAKQFYEVLTQARLFDKKLYTGLRKQLRTAGNDAAQDVRAEVVKDPGSAPVQFHRGLRDNLAAGIKIQIKASESSRQVGVFIASTGKSPASKLLKRKYDNPKGWRHPVFQRGQSSKKLSEFRGAEKEWGNLSGQVKWVTQKGRPYFGSVIARKEAAIAASVEAALDHAVDTIAQG